MKLRAIACLAASAFSFAGCATYQHANEADAKATQREADLARRIAQGNPATDTSATVQYLDKPWVDLTPVFERYQNIDSRFKCDLNIGTILPITVQEFAQAVMTRCRGVNVRITQDALKHLAGYSSPDEASAAGAVSSQGGNPLVPAIAGRPAGVNLTPDNKLDLNIHGDLDEVMAIVTNRLGLSYARETGANGVPTYRIYSIGTWVYRIHMLGGDIDMRSQFDSGTTQVTGTTGNQGSSGGLTSAGQGGQGQSNTLQHVESSIKGNMWTEMGNALRAMGKVTVEPLTGTVTVNDTADVAERVKAYVDNRNQMFDKFVTYQINVYSVTRTQSDSLTANWNLVWKNLAGKGITLANVLAPPTGAITGGYSVLDTSSSPWAGSSAMLSALNQLGNATLTRSTSVTAKNLTLAASQSGSQDGYLAESATSQTAQVGSTATLTPGTINTGFNISLLSNVYEDNSMDLKFQINLSTNNGIRTESAAGSKIEFPSIGLPLNTAQTVPLQPGQTLMLTGQDYDDTTSNGSGAGAAWNWFMGGGKNASRTHTMMVVTITPILSEKSTHVYQ
ncbi:PilN family type IVB pilus formation outer membrane protein [Burkholderia vietnamiensis]|uniref:PilN family type IVB pilus formation outer membrane protein n=1 Tax=Burkholderia vietnamiensis TaxID=60552 RepID=UPI0015945153|nr:PilN family type IVB pilus formation outer membrane protein [Burkholderia vietnamiensis]MCA8270702.1 PilN family type IVB pilus formation outer membrane protein [Burkholderia vietnamiensis]